MFNYKNLKKGEVEMNPAKKTLSILAMACCLVFVSSAAMAHSAHDHSTIPYKWVLSKSLKAKIDTRLNSLNPTSVIGLNSFEQKKLAHYDIKVENKFNTEIRGINLLVKRTSAGMKIIDATRVSRVSYTDQVPIKKANMFSKATTSHSNHAGHDHSYLPYEWTFSLATQDKIVRGITRNEKSILIGLNAFEQSILKEYGIKSGNTFHATVKGNHFLIEKTSAGAKVISQEEIHNVAMAPLNTENM
tara:strand:+ start:2132 stop:2866 length:735 start_codon:yes stop_codon:yes gene_type:complete